MRCVRPRVPVMNQMIVLPPSGANAR
jgi:hypothetical protein